jgi:hypothetical protein
MPKAKKRVVERTLLNAVHPSMRILLPDGDYAQFAGGKLELEPDFAFTDHVLRVAERDPNIVIVTGGVQCRKCGAEFVGEDQDGLEQHMADGHPEVVAAGLVAELTEKISRIEKDRATFPCDACPNPMLSVFPDEETLALHVRAVHTAPPALDDDGNEVGGSGESRNAAASTSTEVPAARPSRSRG